MTRLKNYSDIKPVHLKNQFNLITYNSSFQLKFTEHIAESK